MTDLVSEYQQYQDATAEDDGDLDDEAEEEEEEEQQMLNRTREKGKELTNIACCTCSCYLFTPRYF